MNNLIKALAVSAAVLITNPAQAVFIGDSSGGLWELDVTTNNSNFIGISGVGAMFDIALDPVTGTLYGVTVGATGQLYTIDQGTGAATAVSSAAVGASLNALTFDSAGTLYGTGGTGLYTLDLGTGIANFKANTGFSSSGDIAFDSSGNLYLSANSGPGTDQLIDITATLNSGLLGTALGDFGFDDVFGLNFSGSTLYGFTSGQETITINTLNGAGTLVANNTIAAFGADGVGGVSVPEPSVIALLGVGLIGVGLARRKAA